MIKELLILAVGIFLDVSNGFYLYDRFNNKPTVYHFSDASNVYYTSAAFHSLDFTSCMKPTNGSSGSSGSGTSALVLRKINSSKSLPNL